MSEKLRELLRKIDENSYLEKFMKLPRPLPTERALDEARLESKENIEFTYASGNTYKSKITGDDKMSRLTNGRYENYVNKLIKTTKHSKQQIEAFFSHLSNRMDILSITSLDDLFIRYECISKAKYSERVELLKDVVGFYHLNSLTALMGLLESEKNYKEMITYYNEQLEKQKEIQDGLEVYTKEYQDSLKEELRVLEDKQYYIKRLSELLS